MSIMAASIRVGPLQRAADYFNLLSILRSEIRKVLKFFYLASRLAEPSLLGDAKRYPALWADIAWA
jgi:hypothetical protein